MTNTTAKTAEELIADLEQFTGSEVVYRHSLGMLRYTEGTKYLAQATQCYWLLDAIGSYQHRLESNPRLRDFQVWRLVVKDESGVLICEEDTDKEVLRQGIEYTAFPLSEITLYLAQKVLMLPGEY
ncbi:hypothetical protein FNW02_30580 [Komarekiella sp. 'clone 1']|uniref:DUF6876 domain-containing protein n=1 Tax=Komarekiella delphini-convector SJRDD-AB1 TaxID=2593771 RepID=A0AA40VUS0_9NOST|nr:DUF6876 family protein [Komarekiella delphini-convector]MBD6620026.1 hypothetical protein [Komarekiella delphini-convector SJRDD-AB1]